jgi:hypothetical protein
VRKISAIFRVRAMVLNATFNNISVISWRSVLLVKSTGVPGENHFKINLLIATVCNADER